MSWGESLSMVFIVKDACIYMIIVHECVCVFLCAAVFNSHSFACFLSFPSHGQYLPSKAGK